MERGMAGGKGGFDTQEEERRWEICLNVRVSACREKKRGRERRGVHVEPSL